MLDRELVERGALAVALLGHHQQLPGRLHDLHADDLVAGAQPDAGHAARVAAHRPHLLLVEAGSLALPGGEDDVVLAVGQADPAQLVAVHQADGDQPVGADLGVLGQRGLLDHSALGGHDHVVVGLELREGDDGADVLPGVDLHAGQVHDRQALGLAAGLGQGVDPGDEHATTVREEQDAVVGVRHQQVADRVLLAGDHRQLALAAAALRAERADLLALDVAPLAEGHDHVLGGDQVFGGQLAVGIGLDAGAAIVAVLALQLGQLLLDDDQDLARVGE